MCLKQTVKSWKTLTQLKKAKYVNKHFLEILNTQLKFEVPKMNEKGVSE